MNTPLAAAQSPQPIALTIHEVATMLSISHWTVSREISRGNMRAFKIGRSIRVRIEEVHAYARRLEKEARD